MNARICIYKGIQTYDVFKISHLSFSIFNLCCNYLEMYQTYQIQRKTSVFDLMCDLSFKSCFKSVTGHPIVPYSQKSLDLPIVPQVLAQHQCRNQGKCAVGISVPLWSLTHLQLINAHCCLLWYLTCQMLGMLFLPFSSILWPEVHLKRQLRLFASIII